MYVLQHKDSSFSGAICLPRLPLCSFFTFGRPRVRDAETAFRSQNLIKLLYEAQPRNGRVRGNRRGLRETGLGLRVRIRVWGVGWGLGISVKS